MKKLLSVFLCIALLLTTVSVCVAAADESLPFIVATDLHYAPTPKEAGYRFPGEKYYCAYNVATLSDESNAIIRQFLREAAASDGEFVLLCGDITENGTLAEHRKMAEMLSAFESETGKRVFVTDGNHDFHAGITPQKFTEIYHAFGYDEALATDAQTCSYTADLNDKYRLLSLDSCNYGQGGDGFTAERLAWASEQAQIAKKDGKTLIVMMHHNFLEHIKLESKLLPNFIVRPSVALQMQFLDWGVRYVFTGHLHDQDITAYSDGANRTVYDITTTSLSGYPCAYRTCTLSAEGLQTDTCRIEGVDARDLPQSGYSDELLAELTGDLNAFADGCFRIAYNTRKDKFFGKDSLRKMLSQFGGEAVQNVIDACYPAFYENLNLPIYRADAGDGRSLQALGEDFGLSFRKADRKSVWDSVYFFVTVMYNGDENVPYYDNEIVLFMQCVYTALYDAMRTVNADLRQQLLSDVRSEFKQTALPVAVTGAVKAALGTVRDDRMLETVLLLMAPVIEWYSMDDDVPDNSAFLPAQEETSPVAAWLQKTFGPVKRFLLRWFRGLVRIYMPWLAQVDA